MSARRPGSLPTVQPAAAAAPDPAVVQTAWARVLMESLRRAGTRRLVISPGSRSTPFALAAEHAGLHIRTVIDERSAGFLALGCARACGEPVALLCTSGSAGAHYYPAVIEAAHAFVPLIVITADRPPELHGCAAPQTMDQTRLFGGFARLAVDLGPADGARAALTALARKAAQAAYAARWPVPGPVHINAPARKPLEPAPPRTPADIAVVGRADELLVSLPTRAVAPVARVPDETIESLADACVATSRGLIVVGPMAPWPRGSTGLAHAARGLARATGFPLLAEAASQLRFDAAGATNGTAGDSAAEDGGDAASASEGGPLIDAVDALLSAPRLWQDSAAELIVHIGPPPTSRAFADHVSASAGCVRVVLAEHGWNDPHSSADMMVFGELVDAMERLAAAVAARRPAAPAGEPFAARLARANRAAWRCVDELLAAGEPGAPMREAHAMRAIVAALPRGALLALGNSLPIRTVDSYCPAGSAVVDVLSQRGVNGIDGLISAAAGAAWWAAEAGARAVVAVLGDVTFVHDIGGLAAAAHSRAPLCIVVIDNDGGRIFEQLPVATARHGTSAALFEAHWLTRPRCNMAAAAAAFGISYAEAHAPAELGARVREACRHPGCTVVRAVVEPTSAARDRERLAAAVHAAMDELVAGEGA